MPSVLKQICAFFRPLWAEQRCLGCNAPFVPDNDFPLCADCFSHIQRREQGFCPFCGEPSADSNIPCFPCAACVQSLPPWQNFAFYGIYSGLLRALLLSGKFGGNLAALQFLGSLAVQAFEAHLQNLDRPDALLPMPLHSARLLHRGFNQCLEMARPLAKKYDFPLRPLWLEKKQATPAQATLSLAQRQSLKQPFHASPDVKGKHILLFDDICTSQATLRRATECLLSAGAKKVDVLVVARTSLFEKDAD